MTPTQRAVELRQDRAFIVDALRRIREHSRRLIGRIEASEGRALTGAGDAADMAGLASLCASVAFRLASVANRAALVELAKLEGGDHERT